MCESSDHMHSVEHPETPETPGPSGISKNPKGKVIHSGQKQIIYNVYFKYHNQGKSKTQSVRLTAMDVCVSESTVWKIISEMEKKGIVTSPPKKRNRENIVHKLDEDEKKTIRRIVHGFFLRNKQPTLNEILQAAKENEMLPPISRTNLWRVMKKLGFVWEKRDRNHMLIEKSDIVLWRRRYLNNIRYFRECGRKIYYLDETWLNAGHVKHKVWKDKTVLTARQAFVEDLSVGLKDPSGKGKRLIIAHIGSDTGFVQDAVLMFESKKTGDYHEEMNAEVFEQWLKDTLPNLEENSVIVMDNAPYHSKKFEKAPNSSWKKSDIIIWLQNKGIKAEEASLKVELLDLVKSYLIKNPIRYNVDNIVEITGRHILRLPPYHCKLNPIELIWAQVKGYVAANNKTFNLNDVRKLFHEALDKVTGNDWRKCIEHVIKEENEMYRLDDIIENMEITFTVNTGSSDEDIIDSSSDD